MALMEAVTLLLRTDATMLAGRIARRPALWGTSRCFASSEVPSPEKNESANQQRAREDGKKVGQKVAEGKGGEAKEEASGAFSDMAKGLSEAGKKVSQVAKDTGSRLKETVSGATEGAKKAN